MKKLGKLLINPAKLIKNDKLVTLRGGYGGGTDAAVCRKVEYDTIINLGVVCVDGCSPDAALQKCKDEGYTDTSYAICCPVPCG